MKAKGFPRKKIMLPITIVLAAVAFFTVLYNANTKEVYYQDPGEGVSLRIDDNAVPLADGLGGNQAPGTRIPAFARIILPADSAKAGILLENPADNVCNFVYELSLADTGEVLYKSDMILPGAMVDTVDLNRALAAGEYPAYMKVYTYEKDTLAEMNGATMKTTLLVKQADEI